MAGTCCSCVLHTAWQWQSLQIVVLCGLASYLVNPPILYARSSYGPLALLPSEATSLARSSQPSTTAGQQNDTMLCNGFALSNGCPTATCQADSKLRTAYAVGPSFT